MSKGSSQRPRQVSLDTFDSNWETIFGKKETKQCCGKCKGDDGCGNHDHEESPCQQQTQ
jgi:hypothetical protein